MNPPESASTTVQDTQLSTSSSRKRQWVDDEELDDSPAQFRRVRLRCGRELPDQRNMDPAYSNMGGNPTSNVRSSCSMA